MKYSNFQNQNIVIKKINYFGDILGIHRLNPKRYPYLLQSSAKGNVLSRYDILFSFPQKQIILNFEDIKKKNFLKELDKEWKKDKKKSKKDENILPFDVVLSDIAPNISGISERDDALMNSLLLGIRSCLDNFLKEDGNALCKVFHGESFDNMMIYMKTNFQKVKIRKPDSSRANSSETYILGMGKKK